MVFSAPSSASSSAAIDSSFGAVPSVFSAFASSPPLAASVSYSVSGPVFYRLAAGSLTSSSPAAPTTLSSVAVGASISSSSAPTTPSFFSGYDLFSKAAASAGSLALYAGADSRAAAARSSSPITLCSFEADLASS